MFAVFSSGQTEKSRRPATNLRRVMVICAVFTALIVTGLHSGRDFAALLDAAVKRAGLLGIGGAALKGPQLQVLAPEHPLPQTRVGHLLFASYNSDTCRRALFDNRTGASFDAGEVNCGVVPDPNTQIGQERALSLLRAFRK